MEKILNFCEISGSSVKIYEGKRKYIATGDILNNKIISFEEVDYKNKPSRANQNVEIGDVIFAKMQNTKKVIIITKENVDNIYSTGFYVIKPKKNVTSEFLFWLFNSKKFNDDKDKNCKGATQKAINNEGLNKIAINTLPTIQEQLKIVSKLDKVQEIIDIREKQIEQLDELIKSQFVEMFGDININDKKWSEDILKNNLSVIGGYAFKSSEFQESGIPILRIGNINTGKFRTKDLMFWKEDETLESYAIYPNDVLISLTGTVGKEDYGNICIIGNDYPKYYLNQRNAKLNISETLNKEYISYALRIPEIKRRLTGISRGVRQANISNRDIENLKIPIPPIELQNKFAEFVKQIDKQKFEIQKSLEETQKLQDSLMNKYFG